MDNEIFIKENYLTLGNKKCCEILGLSSYSVTKIAKKYNLVKPRLKNAFSDDFDPLIFIERGKMTKESAYLLGYLWADGFITCNTVTLSITEEDGNSISKILKKTSNWRENHRKREGRKPQVDFFVTNKLFASFLRDYGKYSHTVESHEKILEFINPEFHKFFIRGLIDGDGCYTIINNKKRNSHCAQLFISARYNQDWRYLVNFLKDKYNINFSINQVVNKHGNTSSYIRCSSTKDIIAFIKQVYNEDDGIYLERKYKKTRDILELEGKIKRHFKENRKLK